jgi:two-component system, chemotaxis family, CheB/CheR fusion protein
MTPINPNHRREEDQLDDLNLRKVADQLVLDHCAPVGVVIDNEMNIVQFRGQTGAYLESAPGKPSFNLFKMVKPELLVVLRAAIYQVKQQQQIFRQERIQLKTARGMRSIAIEVIPFVLGVDNRSHILVLFQESAIVSTELIGIANPTILIENLAVIEPTEQDYAQLQQELATTRAYLQAIIAEQDLTNQALQIANEEILSSNEELQSINEELQTSQEELQTTNEELFTINEELNSSNLELNQIDNDLQNLLSSSNITILMLDGELRIRRFTSLAQQIFNLIPTDLGRPFSDIQPNISIPDLGQSILEVIDTLTTQEREIQDRTGHWYSLRIRPYRTIDNRIDGVTIGLINIDTLKHSAMIVEVARDYANAIVETVRQPLLVLNADLRVIRANQCFYQSFGLKPAQTEQESIFELGKQVWNLPSLRSRLETLLSEQMEFQDMEVVQTTINQSPRTLLLNARNIRDDRAEQSILLAIEDITDRRQAEVQLQNSLTEKEVLLREIHHRVKNNLQIVSSLLSLQSNRVTDPQASEILQDSQNRVQAMALIHEILYQSPNLAALNFAEYIQTLVNRLAIGHNIQRVEIDLCVQIEPGITVDVDRAVLCGSIVNELVTNAFKHGFAADQQGQISIKLITNGDNLLTLSVANNGRELPPDFDVHKVRSMGLNLVMSLVKQLKGTLAVKADSMSAFEVTFPVLI